jgi:hypothetical protein
VVTSTVDGVSVLYRTILGERERERERERGATVCFSFFEREGRREKVKVMF